MNKYSEFEEEQFKEKMMSSMDSEMIEWMQHKSKEFIKLMSYYKCAMMEIETKLNVLNEEFSLEHERNPICSIKTRLKTLPSIRKKLEMLGKTESIEHLENELNDIAGVRVVCSFIEDVYTLADALLKQDDVTIIEKKDYIKSPKRNGYRSLHLIVSIPIFLVHEKREMKVEIQLRTIAMDIWASLEHQIKYKSERDISYVLSMDLYECASLSASLDEKMDEIHKKSIEQSYIIKPKASKCAKK